MREINLSDWTKAGEGYEADSYNFNENDDIMLKLYKPYILKSKIEDSFNASTELIKMGVSTPKAFEIVICNDRIGVIYERVKDKISLYRMFVNNHEKAKEYGRIFGKAIRDFHSYKCDITKAVSRYSVIKKVYCGMIAKSDKFTENEKNKILEKMNVFFENFKETENDNSLLMGDAHIGNVIIAKDKLYYIDIASMQYGTPLLEIGWIYGGSFNKQIDIMLPKNEVVPMKYKEMFWEEFIHTYYDGVDENIINANVEKAKKYSIILDLSLIIYMNPSFESIMEVLNVDKNL